MSKNLNVSLAFTANTNEAITQIKRLQKELNSLATGQSLKNSGITQITPEIQKAMSAAGELQAKLESAVNLKTGKLDLTAFSQSLKKGETSLAQYAQQLNALGPAGRQAFTSLAQSIIQAEAPLVRCSNKIRELGTTLANTARWQLSSSILHGFMGSIQSAYGYAEDLNESLNNIRIVTGQNIDQMAKFAVEANKAAKALSTTTTEYTNASLIYYQQGLSDQQVKERTDITIKMANVARQSAEVVSDQMTAIWNNFYDGSKSLEHYADVMTALGAATASSTDEIAGGLEKFSAVAQTIGLSYEYAASALATITSISRESEDVVGTALKTIFARIQGLNLGETLDDGTSLNKYSEALSKVGISIFDQAGGLKDMDTILNEMGAKWETLNAAQKQALAQTVAGVRQYNQLMTLMNNWDSFQANLGVANSSSGALQNQANIYAESWEAARDRVTASAEEIYDKLLSDEFFIDFLNGISKAIDGISNLIDSLGGLRGVLFTIGNIVTKLFQQQMIAGLHNAALTAKSLLAPGLVKKQQQAQKDEAVKALEQITSSSGGATGKAENAALKHETQMQKTLLDAADRLSDEEIKSLQVQMDLVREMDKRAIAQAKITDEAEDELKALKEQVALRAKAGTSESDPRKAGFKAGGAAIRAEYIEGTKHINSKTRDKATEKYNEVTNNIRKKYNLDEKADLSQYQDEIDTEFGKSISKYMNTSANNGIVNEFGKTYSPASQQAKQLARAEAKNNKIIEDQSIAAIENAGRARARGTALSNLGTKFGESLGREKTEDGKITAFAIKDGSKEALQIQDQLQARLAKTIEVFGSLEKAAKDAGMGDEFDPILQKLNQLAQDAKEANGSVAKLNGVIEELESDYSIGLQLEEFTSALEAEVQKDAQNALPSFDATGVHDKARDAEAEKIKGEARSADVQGPLKQIEEKANPETKKDWAKGISGAAEAIMGVGAAITSVQGLIDVFNNPDASAWEKVSGALMSLTSIIPAVTSVMSGLEAVMAATGLALGPLLLVIAGIAAAVAVGVAIWKNYNKEAIEAKKAAKAADELAQSVEETRARVESLKSAFDGYDSAIETLNKCTKGTQEWKDALAAVENEVLNLMTQYPELAKNADLFYRDAETGTLMVNEEAREKLIADAEKAAATAQAASLVGNAVASKEKTDAEKVDLQRSGVRTGIGASYSDGQGGTYYQNYLDVSDIAAANAKDLSGLTQEEYTEKMSELIKEKAQSLGVNLDNYEYQLNSLVEESKKYQDEVNHLAKSTNEAATQMENAANIIANQKLGDMGYGAAEQEMASEAYEAAVKKEYDAYLTKLTGSGINIWSGADNDIYEQALEDLQAAGYNYDKQKTNAVRGTDDNRSFAFLDKNGQEVVRTAEWVAQTIAANKALEGLGDAAEAAKKALTNLEKNTNAETASAVKNLIAHGNFDNLSEDDRTKIKTYEGEGAATSLEADLLASMGLTNSDADKNTLYQSFGVTSADELYAKWQEAWNANDEALKNAGNFLTQSVADAFNNLDTSSLTAADKTALSEYMNQALIESGDIKALTDLYSAVSEGEKDEFLATLKDVDWTTISADELKQKMKDAGVSTAFTTEQLGNLINSMGETAEKTLDYAEAMSIVKDLATGDTISEEDYNKLGDGMEQYFRKMADGTYQLTADADEFYQLIKSQSRQGFIDEIKKAQDKITALQEGKTNGVDRTATQGRLFGSEYGRVMDQDQALQQLQYLKDSGYADESKIKEWQAIVEGYEKGTNIDDPNSSIARQQRDAIAAMQNAVNETMAGADTTITDSQATIATNAEQLLSAATTITELDNYMAQIANLGVEIDYNKYAESLQMLGAQYSNCSAEIEAYNNALAFGNETAIKKAQEQLEASIMLGEAAAEYGLSAEEMEMQAAQMAKTYGLSQRAAAKLAIENQRMNQGVVELSENWSIWKDELNKTDKTTIDYAKAAASLTKTVAKLVGASEDLKLPPDFLESPKIMKLIEKAAEGDIDAINELGVAVAGQTIEMMNLDAMVTRTLQDGTTNTTTLTEFKTAKETVLQGIQELQTAVANGAIGVGDSVGSMGADWASSLNEMAMATGMSVDEMNSLLSSMGVDAEVKTEYVKQTTKVPIYETITSKPEDLGDGRTRQTSQTNVIGYEEMDGVVPVAQINMGENGKSPKITYTGNGNVSSSSTGSGGSASKTEKTKKSDVIERYKEINDKLNDQSKVMNDASKAADRLWGSERVKAMEQVNKALEKNIDLLKDKRAEAQYNLKEDKNALAEAIKTNAGITLTDKDFDENGNFTSYNEILNGLYAEKSAAEKAAGSTTDEHEKEKIDAIQKRIDAVKAAISNYDETNQLIEDLDTEIQDAIYEWQDNNYEVLNAKLEYEIEINDSELEVIDYYLGKIEDDVYAYVEAMGKYQQQSDIYTDSLAYQKTYYDELTAAYEAGKISLQAYKEGLQSSQSAIISNLQSLEESKQAMQDYYGNVVSMATEEIGLYTAEMEQLNSVLDHYTSVMELVGKQDDYVTKNKILTSKASNIKNELAVQSELYKASAEDAEMWSKKMAEAQVGSNEYETYKKNWQAAQQAANDAQDAMLAKTQEWAEAMKAIIENDLAEAAASMEKSLTGGISFDELMTSMERRSSLQEEYLTTTNKIYETNKLMRQAQQEIDKTSNSVAKKRLQGFITETNQLQNQSELSQYELEIQQAKYDLLLAEIALEEAQNAKSTVRLQRDSEGNFGYVYTADASAVNDAEQNLADKQNSLYNIGLQGANDYQQKYAEILQQSQEAITELTQMWMNGEITDRDEFERRKNEITEYYGEKLEQYSKLHSVALSTDTRVVADAWSSDFTDMMTTTEGWHSAVDGYFESAATSMNEWAGVCATTLETSKLNDLDGALKGIDDKSKALITTLMGEDGKGGVVGAMLAQVDKASLVSQSQIDMQNDIQGTITKYENLLTAVNNAYKAMTAPIKPAIDPFGGNYTPDGTTPPGNGTGGGGGNGSGYGNGNYSQEVVQILQQWLNEKSTTDKDISVDGKWGSQSAAMAKAFNYNSIDEVYKAYQEHVTKVTTITDYAYEDDDGKYQGSYKTAKEAAEAAPGGEYAIYESTRRKGTAFHMGPPFFIGYAKNLTDKWKEKEKKHHGGGGGHSSFDPIVRVAFGETGPIPLATGGYTGSWGSYGKLAMLHEKELVLNQGDTANFLTSMEVLERILQVLDLQAFSSQVGGLLSSPGFRESGSQNIQQHIEINAEFPNATDRFEIEEAFKSMANLASQYANQK